MQEHPKESCFRWPSFKHCKLVIKLNATDCDVPVTTFLTHPFNTPLLAGLSLLLLEFSRPKKHCRLRCFCSNMAKNVSIFCSVSLIFEFRMLLRIRSFGKIRVKTPDFLRKPWLAGMAPPHLIGEWNQRFQDALHCGKRGTFVTCFGRKLAKVYFRHMDAAKEKPCIAKGSRKRWRKGRQNRTQGNGVLATAQVVGFTSLKA